MFSSLIDDGPGARLSSARGTRLHGSARQGPRNWRQISNEAGPACEDSERRDGSQEQAGGWLLQHAKDSSLVAAV